ncbi:MAG: lipoate--protein ligase family protein [Candidatus Heimdallarchaeota archaeon]|nr:MAG: lipoate--protein ligase family protein [Candidatus Heimdallarchaeota archaeon]
MKNLNWRLLKFSVNNASMNMAIDEAIFHYYTEDTIRLYGWKPSAVSIGKHQQISREVDLDSLEKLGFDCVRRISGGGAVFHDEVGEVTYSVVTKVHNLESMTIDESYFEISQVVFRPLEKLGLTLDYGQIHCPSVFSKGKKISGNAQSRQKDIILQHGTILIKFRPEIMYSVLKARPGRTRESMIESVYQHITTLAESLDDDLSPSRVAEYLIRYLVETSSSQSYIGELTEKEQELAIKLASTKYKSKEWLFKGSLL